MYAHMFRQIRFRFEAVAAFSAFVLSNIQMNTVIVIAESVW